MKKNVMMRLAAILLVCVLASTCGISGTYAKYVTSDSGFDTARVAKWGVTIEATGETFGQNYYSVGNGNGVHASYEATTDTVKSSDTDNVVAPGTNGLMSEVVLKGTPEVDFKVTYSAQFNIGNKWTDGTKFYCPLVVKVTKLDGTETVIKGIDCTDAADFSNKVVAAIAACSFEGKAGTDLSTLSASACVVTWEWPFETGDTQDEKDANNIRDTYLGDEAADGNAAQIYFEITCTIEQVD